MSAAVLPPPGTPSPPPSGGGGADPKTANSAAAAARGANTINPSSIVFPPPDLRGIIEKTAQFVAKNGIEFEQRVRREQNNQRFAFLFPSNPYNAYYQLKVREFQTGEEAPKPQVPQAILDMRQKEEEERKKRERVLMLTQYGEEARKKVEPPPPDVYSVPQPYIAPIDVDIIQTTAQFVARNGQRFLSGLAQRERQNPQFEFLKPTHALFQYFTNLVDAYTKCLLPPPEQMTKVTEIAASTQNALSRCVKRFAWELDQEKKKREKEEKNAAERSQMQAIDWHDFFIVETIDFTEEDDLLPLAAPVDFSSTAKRPPPETLGTIEEEEPEGGVPKPGPSIAALIREAADAAEGVEEEEEEMETEEEPAPSPGPPKPSEDTEPAPSTQEKDDKKAGEEEKALSEADEEEEEEEELPLAPAVPAPAPKSSVRVVKDYVRQPRKRAGAAATEAQSQKGLQKCPITGQLVPAEQMSNHLRVLLLDPKWKEQKERFLEKAKAESAFAPMEDVEGNLALFVSKRPDLFGSVDEQVVVEDKVVTALVPEGTVPGPASSDSTGKTTTGGAGAGSTGQGLSSRTATAPPPSKRPRTEPEAATGGKGISLAIVCVAGGGLEEQELEVEVDEKMTVRALKQSLAEADLGPGITADKLVLRDEATGSKLMDRRTIDSYGAGKPGFKLLLSVASS